MVSSKPSSFPSSSVQPTVAQGLGGITTAALFVGFALLVFLLQGSQPSLGIDHIAYLKLTDQIMRNNPEGNYWHDVSAVTSYSVLLAYLHPLTGSHILSLKWLLVGVTVAYLYSADYFCRAFTSRRRLAIIMALSSACYVSFGATFWGVTDFAASLNRSVAVPAMLWLLGAYFRASDSPKRFWVLPALITASILHLGTYHLWAILVALEAALFAYAALRGRRPPWAVIRLYLIAVISSLAMYRVLTALGVSGTSFALVKPPPNLADHFWTLENLNIGEALSSPAWMTAVSSQTAWQLEIESQPWRNFPPPLATLAGIAGSALFVFCAAFWSGRIAVKRTGFTSLDQKMLWFGGVVLAGSYGLQSTLWILRHFFPVYPMNFEEVRMLYFLILPALYFVIRGLDVLWHHDRWIPANLSLCGIILGLYLIQPIYLLRCTPRFVREKIYSTAVQFRLLDAIPSQRNAFARSYLHLTDGSEQLYYPMVGVLQWLNARILPTDRVLTNRDDLYLLNAQVVGTSNGFLDTNSASLRRLGWSAARTRLQAAIRAQDLPAIKKLGREISGRFAVIPWPVEEAVFSDQGFSIVALTDK